VDYVRSRDRPHGGRRRRPVGRQAAVVRHDCNYKTVMRVWGRETNGPTADFIYRRSRLAGMGVGGSRSSPPASSEGPRVLLFFFFFYTWTTVTVNSEWRRPPAARASSRISEGKEGDKPLATGIATENRCGDGRLRNLPIGNRHRNQSREQGLRFGHPMMDSSA